MACSFAPPAPLCEVIPSVGHGVAPGDHKRNAFKMTGSPHTYLSHNKAENTLVSWIDTAIICSYAFELGQSGASDSLFQ